MNEDHEHTDLGVSPKELYGGNLTGLVSQPDSAPEKIYPSFRYEGPEELHLPDSGKMEICFNKRSETSRTDNKGKHWYECCIEVRCFGEVESDEPDGDETTGTDAEKALDTIARALGKERSEEY